MQDSRTKPQFAPCIFTGQEAGTADALAAQNKVTPMELDVKLLPDTLNKQRARVSLKYVANAVG